MNAHNAIEEGKYVSLAMEWTWRKEMNKFDSMMAFLKWRLRSNFADAAWPPWHPQGIWHLT